MQRRPDLSSCVTRGCSVLSWPPQSVRSAELLRHSLPPRSSPSNGVVRQRLLRSLPPRPSSSTAAALYYFETRGWQEPSWRASTRPVLGQQVALAHGTSALPAQGPHVGSGALRGARPRGAPEISTARRRNRSREQKGGKGRVEKTPGGLGVGEILNLNTPYTLGTARI